MIPLSGHRDPSSPENPFIREAVTLTIDCLPACMHGSIPAEVVSVSVYSRPSLDDPAVRVSSSDLPAFTDPLSSLQDPGCVRHIMAAVLFVFAGKENPVLVKQIFLPSDRVNTIFQHFPVFVIVLISFFCDKPGLDITAGSGTFSRS